MWVKAVLSGLATVLTVLAFFPYIRSIWSGQTKPHVFSWVIWGVTTCIAFFAQWVGGAGVGAWPIGISGVITLGIAVLAYTKRDEIVIAFWDWVFFVSALAALPFWMLTSDPFWAILVLTIVDLLGFLPTIRKCVDAPEQENMSLYVIMFFRNLAVLGALETYSWTTVLFPAAMSVAIIPIFFLLRRSSRPIS